MLICFLELGLGLLLYGMAWQVLPFGHLFYFSTKISAMGFQAYLPTLTFIFDGFLRSPLFYRVDVKEAFEILQQMLEIGYQKMVRNQFTGTQFGVNGTFTGVVQQKDYIHKREHVKYINICGSLQNGIQHRKKYWKTLKLIKSFRKIYINV